MQHGGDYRSYYTPEYPPPVNPNASGFPSPNPVQPSYASAPPYSDIPAYSAAPYATTTAPADPSYAHYVQNPEPASEFPPPSSSYAQPQPQFPAFSSYDPSPYPPAPAPAPSQYYTYDPSVQTAGYAPPMNPGGAPLYDAPIPPPYGSSAGVFDRGAGYFDDDAARFSTPTGEGYGRSLPGFEQDPYGKRPESNGMTYDDGFGDGVYAYDGGRSEPYGARGTVPGRSQALFDDYGRSLSLPSSEKDGGSLGRIVRAEPKAETQQDAKNGVQKFRVKLLSEGGGQSTMDVLCQIGLDGIRMLDPSTSRTLRIYPLDTVTRWEVIDTSTFTFWSKSSVDIDPKRIRLQSNSYTTNTILDTVTAATVQLKEMGGKDSVNRGAISSDAGKLSEATEKKKGLIDWVNLMKPANEEKDHWVPDEAVRKCTSCGSDFGAFNRRHHCRNCGDIFCDKCTQGRISLTADENAQPVRVCDSCLAEVSQRLSNTKEAANRPVGVHSHEDLARKLQEEMEKNRKSSSGSKSSGGSGRQTREVACPICTVHLQVQVPTSGSETIECGVCQHPFLVSAN